MLSIQRRHPTCTPDPVVSGTIAVKNRGSWSQLHRVTKAAVFAVLLTVFNGIGIPTANAQRAGSVAHEQVPAEQWIKQFEETWDESKWEKEFRGIDGFMRPLGDEEWKSRFLALQGVVKDGNAAIPILLQSLQHSDDAHRIFAAQALRFLAHETPVEPLMVAATTDSNPTVRMYAVDVLGMKGDVGVDFESMKKNESNRDVKSHINYAFTQNLSDDWEKD